MPDLTIQNMEMCQDLDNGMWTVPSSSSPSEAYVVFFMSGMWHFECSAFKFSRHTPRTCKHIKQKQEEMCDWHPQGTGPAQKKKGVCPKCGGPTIPIQVAV